MRFTFDAVAVRRQYVNEASQLNVHIMACFTILLAIIQEQTLLCLLASIDKQNLTTLSRSVLVSTNAVS